MSLLVLCLGMIFSFQFSDHSSHPITFNQSWSIPPRSMSLQESGDAKVGALMPWVAGWDLTEHPINLNMILNQNRKGYVMMLCATWCSSCKEGLRMLINARHQLEIEGIQMILAFSENITLSHLTTWLNEQIPPQVSDRFRNLTSKTKRKKVKKSKKKKSKTLSQALQVKAGTPMLSPWSNVLIFQDRYLTVAKKLGAYKADGDTDSKRLDLPRVIVFDQHGIVVDIIHQEGYDFIERVRMSLE